MTTDPAPFTCLTPGAICREPGDCAYGCREGADAPGAAMPNPDGNHPRGTYSRRHALAFNALTWALGVADQFVPFSVRDAATRAVLDALDADHNPAPGADNLRTIDQTSARTETGPTIATAQVGVVVREDNAGDSVGDRDGLRERYADALRAAAYSCDGECGGDEATCIAAHPIQEAATSHGVISDLYGPIDAIADVVAGVRDAEMERLRGEVARLQVALRANQTAVVEALDRAEGAEAEFATTEEAMPDLTVTFIPELRRVSVCESGRHEHHIGQTCAEVDAEPSTETLIGDAFKDVWPGYGVMTEQEAEDAFAKRLHDYLEDNMRRNRIGPYSVSRLIEEFEDGRRDRAGQAIPDTDTTTED